MRNIIRTRAAATCLAVVCALLTGCATRGDKYFKVWTDREAPGEGSRVAVVCGTADGMSRHYAHVMEDRLRSRGRFLVLGETEVKSRYPEYPVNILRDGESIDERDDENLARIGTALGADFVLAAWVVGYESSVNLSPFAKLELGVLARMVSVKERRFIGVSGFVLQIRPLLGGINGDIVAHMLDDAAEMTTRKMLSLMEWR